MNTNNPISVTQIMEEAVPDTVLMDWLTERSDPYAGGWICRPSVQGRGMRLHQASGEDDQGWYFDNFGRRPSATPRQAILEMMIAEDTND